MIDNQTNIGFYIIKVNSIIECKGAINKQRGYLESNRVNIKYLKKKL